MKHMSRSVSTVLSLALAALLAPPVSAGVPKVIVAEDFGATW